DTEEDHNAEPQGVEGAKQEQENQRERRRDHKGKAIGGGLEVLELSAEGDLVAGGEPYFRVDPTPDLLDEAFDVPSADVRLHGGQAGAVLVRDPDRSLLQRHRCER